MSLGAALPSATAHAYCDIHLSSSFGDFPELREAVRLLVSARGDVRSLLFEDARGKLELAAERIRRAEQHGEMDLDTHRDDVEWLLAKAQLASARLELAEGYGDDFSRLETVDMIGDVLSTLAAFKWRTPPADRR